MSLCINEANASAHVTDRNKRNIRCMELPSSYEDRVMNEYIIRWLDFSPHSQIPHLAQQCMVSDCRNHCLGACSDSQAALPDMFAKAS